MNSMNPSGDVEIRHSRTNPKNSQVIKVIQRLSQLVTLVFTISLGWSIFQAAVNGNPLPVWAWIGVLTLLAAAIGLGVAVVVYKGVANEVGPFDFSLSNQVNGELITENRRVETAGASSLQVDVQMTAGVLELMGGTAEILDAMDGTFIYDNADWKSPVVEYAVDTAGQGDLIVKQPTTHRPAMRQGRSEWEIRLNQTLPTSLKVKFGAGKAALRLGGMNLSRLRVESGVGELTVDFSGEWQRSLEAFIKAGIGDTVLNLPQDAGVRVQTTIGLGSVKPHNLTWDGSAYVNDLYGKSAVSLDITVEGGMGKLTMEQ